MVESAPGTPRPTEPERRIRTRVPYSGEVIWNLDSRRQAGHLVGEEIPSHYTPEAPEELECAQVYTQRMQELMQDNVLGFRLAEKVFELAQEMMELGEISEEQYLMLDEMNDRTLMGDSYQSFDTPERYIKEFGSIHDQEPPNNQ